MCGACAEGRPADRRPRVVVTGAAVTSPAGNTLKEALQALLAAESTATRLPALADGDATVRFGCAVRDIETDPVLTPRERNRLDRPSQLALRTALEAVRHSGVDLSGRPDRAGVYVGTGVGGLGWMERTFLEYHDRLDRIPPHTVLRVMHSAPAALMSARLGVTGTGMTVTTACASGSSAIGEATQTIRRGDLDVVVAGGVDAPLYPLLMSAFAAMRALSRRNDSPESACRPFDDDRDGFVMGEGAAFVVLERLDHATARGATVLGEVLGYGSTTDIGHLVAPAGDGSPAVRSVKLALADARLAPTDVGHVSAHGTSTVLNDRTEALALARVFGPDCPPVTAPKGVVGHMIGAAGAFEAVLGLLCAAEGVVPPVANFRSGRDAEAIDLVHGVPRQVAPAPVLSTSFGFGGQNTCLVLAPPG